jgi:hypothetical protein
LTVEPRTVEVRVLRGYRKTVPHLVSPTPVPATLQACREARNQGLYKQAFSEVAVSDGAERRYVWLNLEIDIISLGTNSFRAFAPVAPLIRRLKFERSNSEGWFYHGEVREIADFVNAKEIHVVCEDSMEAWWGASDEHYWPCSKENLFFMDPHDGRMMRSIEMENLFDERHEEEYRQAYGTALRDDYPNSARLS